MTLDAIRRGAPLGIVCAMAEEVRTLKPHLQAAREVRVGGRRFFEGRMGREGGGHAVVTALSGIGKVAAAATTALLLSRFEVAAVLFTGVAGGLGEGVAVGDVVVARELIQHDMDASPIVPRFMVPGRQPGGGRARFAADAVLSDALAAAARAQGAKVHEGLVASGDRFIATAAQSMALRQALPQVLAVDMEGAAAAQVCDDFGRPFAMVRTISDRADDAAHVDFQRFLQDVAAELTHRTVMAMLLTV